MKPSSYFIIFPLSILLIIGVSCHSTMTFKSKVMTKLRETEKIGIYKRGSSGDFDTLVKHYKKGSKEFNKIVKGLTNATDKGIVIKTISDKKIILLVNGNKKLLELEHSSVDGRVIEFGSNIDKPDVLFVDKDTRKVINDR